MKHNVKNFSMIITAVCAAILFALYCTSFEFDNIVDPKNSGGSCNPGINCDADVGRCHVEIGCLNVRRINCAGIGTFEFGESCVEDIGNVSCGDYNSATHFCDERNGASYRFVTIGTQTWMAENLNYAIDDHSWCYDDDESNCDTYGRLYSWMGALVACPAGWHLPQDSEWTALVNTAGGASVAGTKLKSSSGWESWQDVPAGTDDFGFSALPGGSRSTDGNFWSIGQRGVWWTLTANDATTAHVQSMIYVNESVNTSSDNISRGFSVRCVRD